MKLPKPNNHSYRLWLVLIFFIALLLRLWYLYNVVHAPDFVELRQDMSVQDYHARAILSGDWTLPPGRNDPKIITTPYYRPPAYTYLLAAIYYVSNGSYLAPRIFNIILGLSAIVLMFRFASLIFGQGVALFTSALMAVYWGGIFYEGEVNDPAIFVFLLPCLFLLLHRWQKDFSVKWILFVAVLTGCYALMRPNILLYGPFMAAWLLWVGRRHKQLKAVAAAWLALAGITALVIAPVTVRNYMVSGEFVPISTYFGENLHIGYNEDADGYTSWSPYLQKLEGSGQFSVWEYDRMVQGLGREVGNPRLTHSEASYIFARKALAWIKENPGAALRLTLKKALLFWSPWEITENKVVQYEKYYYGPLKYLPGFPHVLALFLFGSILLIRDGFKKALPWQQHGSGSSRWSLLALVYGLIAVYWISFFPFFVNARARHPLYPFLFLIGAYGLYRLWQLLLEKKFLSFATLAVLFAAFYLLSSVNFVDYQPDKARWHYARAESWLRSGEVEKAKPEAEQLLQEKYALYMPFRIGYGMEQKKEYKLAEKLLHAALGSGEQSLVYQVDLYFNIGGVLMADGRMEEAREAYEEALRLNPQDCRAHNDLGILLEQEGDTSGALASYQAAVAANPDFVLAWSNMGDLLGRQGDHEGAVQIFKTALQHVKNNPEFLYNLAVHLNAAGRQDEAILQYKEVLKWKPKDLRALNNLALLYQEEGDTEAALELFNRALALSPKYSLARDNLAILLTQLGQFEESVRVYTEGIALDPENADLLNGLGYHYAVQGDYQKAIDYYQQVLQRYPHFTRARVNLARAWEALGESGQALQEWEVLSQEDPDNSAFLIELGNACLAMERYTQARHYYERVLEVDPENEAAAKNLELMDRLEVDSL